MAIQYHVFLSHCSADKPAVEAIARRLRVEGLEPWLDTWNLIPGAAWQPALEQALGECATCVVFIGPGGMGPWQNEEMRAAINRRAAEAGGDFRVIPVLLPGIERPERSKLPAFLAATTWVEFRKSVEDESEAFRRLVAGIRGIAPGPAPGEAVAEGACPYRGLEFFDVKHGPFFFGREALTEWLVNELRPPVEGREANRFLAIVGASGSGKSSLARAGLVVALERGAIAASDRWPVAICRPGPDPLESLAIALAARLDIGGGAAAVGQLIDALGEDDHALHLTARLALAKESSDHHRLVVLVDQFEEVFTRCTDAGRRTGFIGNLLYASRIVHGQTIVVLTMRADFYGKCAAHTELAAALSDHHVLVGPMSDEELRRAIQRPAQLAGCEFESGLVDLLLRDVREESGGLPLLQHALLELWEKREGRRMTAAAYRAIGGLAGALEMRANAVLGDFDVARREVCRRLFLRLTQPGEGTEDTKRRAPLREVLAAADDPAVVEAVVQTLADARLVTTESNEPRLAADAFIEVAHEALIRNWSQLRKWIDADRAGLRTHRRLTEAASEWENNRRDASYLYAGARLAVAGEWAEGHPDELNPLETEFLAASTATEQKRQKEELEIARHLATEAEARQHAEAERASEAEARVTEQAEAARRLRRRARLAAGAALVALILLGASLWMFRLSDAARRVVVKERDRAEHQTRVATARALAGESNASLEAYPQRAILLAVEALNISTLAKEPRVPAAEQALRDALAIIAGRGFTGHRNIINALAISADGHWLATGSEDCTVRLWDLRAKDPTAKVVVLDHLPVDRVKKELLQGIRVLAISPDSRWLAAGGDVPTRLWDLRSPNPASSPIHLLRDRESTVSAMTISPDGHWLAAADWKGTVGLWNLMAANPADTEVLLSVDKEAFRMLRISGDSRWLVAGNEKRLRLWDLTALDRITSPIIPPGGGEIETMVISPDNRWLLTGGAKIPVQLWDLSTVDPATVPILFRGEQIAVRTMAISSDGRWLATGGADGKTRLWDFAAKDPAPTPAILDGHQGWIDAIVFSPNGTWLASTIADKRKVHISWLGPQGPLPGGVTVRGHEGKITAMAITPDGKALATASEDGAVRLCHDVDPLPTLRGPSKAISMALSPRGRWLAVASEDNIVRLWDLNEENPREALPALRCHGAKITAMSISPDGRLLATGCDDGTARLWELNSDNPAPEAIILSGHEAAITALAFLPDARHLVTGSKDKTARIWEVNAKDSTTPPTILRGHEDEISALALSQDGGWLATGSVDTTARVWDLRAEDPAASATILRAYERGAGDDNIERLSKFLHRIQSLALSPDGRWLVTGNWKAQLWDMRTKATAAKPLDLVVDDEIASAFGQMALRIFGISTMVISSDSRWLAIGSGANTVRLFDLEAKNPAAAPIILRGHLQAVRALTISADSRWLATGSSDTTARLWDLAAENPAAAPIVLRGHEKGVGALSISPDNRWLVTESADNTIRLWHLQLPDLIALARVRTGRNFSRTEWEQYFPGQPYRKTFPDLPGAEKP